ncbi:MAG: DNA polymerase I [Clostridia bacterium]|nr:DNA polymerase I [Clostridia bacterium]
MDKLVVIDGNSILNRAFYGIMGSKMLQTSDGTYTNAVYGFLTIMFKLIEDLEPKYMVVAFDLKAPTKRHELYKEYKGTRHGMPDELASQMPIIKEVLSAMNITVITKEGYEADDILGTLSRYGEANGLEVVLLTGDRDSFQLATNQTIIRIPRTKQGKTETENFDREKIIETYGVEPIQLIEVKGLMGDTSDNIPGVPGVGEKTALNLIKEYGNIDNLYEKIENGEAQLKGKLLENLVNNKELAYLSRELGRIDIDSPIEKDLDKFKIVEWDKEKVLELFKTLRFNKFIERFNLETDGEKEIQELFEIVDITAKEARDILENDEKIYYYFEKIETSKKLIIKKEIKNLYLSKENKVYVLDFELNKDYIKEIFEDKNLLKVGYEQKVDYIILKENGINPENLMYDIRIAGYLLNSVSNAYSIEELARLYLNIDFSSYSSKESVGEQTSLFDEPTEDKKNDFNSAMYANVIFRLEKVLTDELEKIDSLELFKNIEMPAAEVLADMQYQGVYVDQREIVKFGEKLKKSLEELKIDICKMAGEEFNINSTKQLGEILFEKLGLTIAKKTKSGYSTDVETLEKIKDEHPIIEKILEYRKLMKLNSTYVEGMIPFINEKTGRVHTYFHQTVTATGRISSTEPNLQNIPTRTELGKKIRKFFKVDSKDKIFVDADYSQIELRVLAHMSKDEIMVDAFNQDADIHAICASQVFDVPLEKVSKQLRSRAKAVNFGIVYGISEFGLAEQIDIKRNEAKKYIDQYLTKYSGIKQFMDDIVEEAKEKGYVETIYHRRRYIPELKSNNYMVRKFGDRAAMNTPIQGTAADIMKIAMIKVYNELKTRHLKSKIVLQIHDELLIETYLDEKDEVKEVLKNSMESAAKLLVPLVVDVEEGISWYQTK